MKFTCIHYFNATNFLEATGWLTFLFSNLWNRSSIPLYMQHYETQTRNIWKICAYEYKPNMLILRKSFILPASFLKFGIIHRTKLGLVALKFVINLCKDSWWKKEWRLKASCIIIKTKITICRTSVVKWNQIVRIKQLLCIESKNKKENEQSFFKLNFVCDFNIYIHCRCIFCDKCSAEDDFTIWKSITGGH